MNTEKSFEDEVQDLTSAEDFLDYFDVPYEIPVVCVKRLHILQRFHDYLAKQEAGKIPSYDGYRQWLLKAYEDLRVSDAQTEKVFAVFQRSEGSSFMPLTQFLS